MVLLRSGRSAQSREDTKLPQMKGSGEDCRQLHLVTGGGGYVGYQLGLALLSKGHHVKLLDIREPDGELHQDMIYQKVFKSLIHIIIHGVF